MIAEFTQICITCDVQGCNTTLAQEPSFEAARKSARSHGHFVEGVAVDIAGRPVIDPLCLCDSCVVKWWKTGAVE